MIFSHSSCSSYTTSVVIINSVRALQIGTIILLLNSSVDYCNSSFTLEILELLNCLLPMFKLKLIEGWTISASNQLHELLLKVRVSCSVIKSKIRWCFTLKLYLTFGCLWSLFCFVIFLCSSTLFMIVLIFWKMFQIWLYHSSWEDFHSSQSWLKIFLTILVK